MRKEEDLAQAIGESFEYAHQYVRKEMALIKIDVAERVALSTSAILTLAVVGFLVAMVILMFSIAIGLWLGSVLDSYSLAFVIMAAIYGLMTAIVLLFRRTLLTNPIIGFIIKSFF